MKSLLTLIFAGVLALAACSFPETPEPVDEAPTNEPDFVTLPVDPMPVIAVPVTDPEVVEESAPIDVGPGIDTSTE